MHYKIQDYLGNVRAVVNQKKQITGMYDYMPFGQQINVKSNNSKDRLSFIGKEKDAESGLGDFGVRKYDEGGRFLSIDPLWEKYYSLTPYHYCGNNPIGFKDDNGKDAICLVFPNYKIGFHGFSIPGLGHAGVLLIDNKTGNTTYFAFGRYNNDPDGQVKKMDNLGKVSFDENGIATKESLSPIFQKISDKDGQKSWIKGAYIKSDKYEEMLDFANNEQQKAKNDSPDRNKYSIFGYNCGYFSMKVASQDPKVKIPYSIDSWNPIPNGQVNWLGTKYPIITWAP